MVVFGKIHGNRKICASQISNNLQKHPEYSLEKSITWHPANIYSLFAMLLLCQTFGTRHGSKKYIGAPKRPLDPYWKIKQFYGFVWIPNFETYPHKEVEAIFNQQKVINLFHLRELFSFAKAFVVATPPKANRKSC